MSESSIADRLSAINTKLTGILRNANTQLTDKGKPTVSDISEIPTAMSELKNPTGTINITENGTVDVTNYAEANVDVQGGGEQPESPLKDVNFYDYNGVRVYSYTADEFANLTAMPANPSHSGLTAQGWNWDLEDAKEYVLSHGKLNIGQMYITDDGVTRIYIELKDGRLKPNFTIAVNGKVSVNWGDGSKPLNISGSSLTYDLLYSHTYPKEGEYIITIKVNSGEFAFRGTSNGTKLLWNNSNSSISKAYQTSIKKIFIGDGITSIDAYSFGNCHSLNCITVPNSIKTIKAYAFRYAYSLSNIILPKSITKIENTVFYYCYGLSKIIMANSLTSIGEDAFNSCFSLDDIILPDSLTNLDAHTFDNCLNLSSVILSKGIPSIKNYVFNSCQSLAALKVPSNITAIGSNSFYRCSAAAYFDFSQAVSIPSLSSSNSFTSIPSDCKIVVPDELYEEWIAASNWSSLASKTIKASEFNI